MRGGFTPALEQRLRCADPSARVLVEAQSEVRVHLKQLRSEFEGADGVTLRENDFAAQNLIDAVGETAAVTLANAPAGNDLYVVHYAVEIDPVIPGGGENIHELIVALESSPDGSAWTERDRTQYRIVRPAGAADTKVVWRHEVMFCRVTSLTSSAQLRLKAVSTPAWPGGAAFRVHGFNKATDADPRTGVASPSVLYIAPAGTANAAPIAGCTYHTGLKVDYFDYGVELADYVTTKISHGSSDGYITDLDGPPFSQAASPFLVARVVWGGTADPSDLAIDRITAFLHPQETGTKNVARWWCQPYAISAVGQKRGSKAHIEMVPLASAVSVEAGAGTSAGDVTFRWEDAVKNKQVYNNRPRPKSVAPGLIPDEGSGQGAELSLAEIQSVPTTLVFFWATKEDGSPATNVGLGRDSGTTQVTSSGRQLRTVEITRTVVGEYEMEGPDQLGATPRAVARVKIETGSYSNATITFSGAGNKIDLGGTPTGTVEFVGSAEVPVGALATFQVLKDGGSAGTDADWRTYTDGQIVGEIADVTARQTYEVRCKMETNSGGDLTPRLLQIGVRELTRKPLWHLASVKAVRWGVDPLTGIAEIPECRIVAIKDGERDFRDVVTELFSDNDLGAISLRLFVGDPNRPRSEWLHLDDFLLDDTDPGAASLEVTGVSPLALLRGVIPKWDSTNQDREQARYANVTPREAVADILANHIALPARYRGPSLPVAGTFVTKTLHEADAKRELDALHWLAGHWLISSQGRVKAVPGYQGGGALRHWPAGELRMLATPAGYRQRIPEFFFRYHWSDEDEVFAGEIRAVHAQGLTRLGVARIDPPQRPPEEVERWVVTEQHAEELATRQVVQFGLGMPVWRLRTSYAYPELEPGDRVTFPVDQFVARDPAASRALRGAISVTATIVAVEDAIGKTFKVWVLSYGDLVPVKAPGRRRADWANRSVVTAQFARRDGVLASAEAILSSPIATANIYWVYQAATAAVPVPSTTSPWTLYTGALNLARDTVSEKVLVAFFDDRGVFSVPQSWKIEAATEVTVPLLTPSQTGTSPNIKVTWNVTPHPDARYHKFYIRKNNWPTVDTTQGGVLDDAFMRFLSHKTSEGGAVTAGGFAPGGLSQRVFLDNYSTVGPDVSYCIIVPIDVNGNAGTRKEASYTVTGTPSEVTMNAPSLDTAGSSCSALRKYDFSWTPTGIDDTWELRLYAVINGRRDLIHTEGSPNTTTSLNAIEVLAYLDASAGDVDIDFEFELYNSTPTLKQSGNFGGDGFKGARCAV